MFSCSGTKEFDEVPRPIGGDEKVRSVFQQVLGSVYDVVEGSEVVFSISINENGVVEKIGMSRRTSNEYVNRTVVFALKDNIRFTPAVKDGSKVKANFEYNFTF